MRTNTVKAALREGQAQIGTWLSLASPLAARFMTRSGFHWLTLDMEHTPVDWSVAAHIFATIADAGSIPLVRIPFNSLENVKRALDAGAYGIVFPMCNTVEEAERAVAACKYPPQGERSIGGALHTFNFSTTAPEYFARANDEILVIVQAEHVQAVENCEQILAVPGIDGMFVGPNDLLSSMHKTPNMESEDPDLSGRPEPFAHNRQPLRHCAGYPRRQREGGAAAGCGRLALHCHQQRNGLHAGSGPQCGAGGYRRYCGTSRDAAILIRFTTEAQRHRGVTEKRTKRREKNKERGTAKHTNQNEKEQQHKHSADYAH